MGRPKASAQQEFFAHQKYWEGMSPKAILIAIETEFEEPVSLSTVERWCKRLRQSATPQDKLMNSPFQWERMAEVGLPWEAGEWLMQHYSRTPILLLNPIYPTFNYMVWCWRVHCTFPELDHEAVNREAIRAMHAGWMTDNLHERSVPNSMRLTQRFSQIAGEYRHMGIRPYVDSESTKK